MLDSVCIRNNSRNRPFSVTINRTESSGVSISAEIQTPGRSYTLNPVHSSDGNFATLNMFIALLRRFCDELYRHDCALSVPPGSEVDFVQIQRELETYLPWFPSS